VLWEVSETVVRINQQEEQKIAGFGPKESYGAIPKTIKFSATLVDSAIKRYEEVLPWLKMEEFDVLLSLFQMPLMDGVNH